MRVTNKTTYKLTQREAKDAIHAWMRREHSVSGAMTIVIDTTRVSGWAGTPIPTFKVSVAKTHDIDNRPRNRR